MYDIYLRATQYSVVMSKLNWSCTSCGMSSARRSSVQRHIDNPNIHGGGASVIPFTEYSAGITSGKYRTGQKPRFASSDRELLTRLIHKINLEMENQIAKDIAKRLCKRLENSTYGDIEFIARMDVFLKQYEEIAHRKL